MSDPSIRVSIRGQVFSFAASAAVTLGRDPDSVLVVDHPRVSRHHASLEFGDGNWHLVDAGSSNGTYVDGERVTSMVIAGSTRVLLGGSNGQELELNVEQTQPAAALETSTFVGRGVNETSYLDPALARRAALSGAATRIGRADDNDVVLSDLLVSRYHAELRVNTNATFEVHDLGSHNGTFVNGVRVESSTEFTTADLLTVGHHLFRLEDDTLVEFVDDGSLVFGAASLSVVLKDGTQLLDSVSVALEERGFLAVVGPSGSGKSTLLRALAGLRPADSGVVSYAGRDLYASYDELRHRIGYVPQDDVLHVRLSVREALAASAELRFPPETSSAERSARVGEVMEELGLERRADVAIASLSGGQRKRVSVAVELLTRPSLLFLDEPTSGLDPGTERSVMELLRELADTGRTVIVVTHSVDSLHLCDRVLVLSVGGRTAYFGPPQLAPVYFGRDDMQGVFQRLNSEPERDWSERFAAHPDRKRFVPETEFARTAVASSSGRPAPRSRARQLLTLMDRDLRIMTNDRRTAFAAVAQGPLLGLVLLAALQQDSLAVTDDVRISGATISLVMMVVATSLIGISNGLRAIVGEKSIYERERRAGLSSGAYLASKLVVLGSLTVAQVVVMSALALSRQGGPSDALVLGNGRLEFIAVMCGGGLAALALALAISASVRSTDQALAMLPVVLIGLMIFAIPAVASSPVTRQLSYAASSQWAMRAAASTADLNRLELVSTLIPEVGTPDQALIDDLTMAFLEPDSDAAQRLAAERGDPRFAHDQATWLWAMVGLGVTAIAALVVAFAFLRR